jgi:predicted transcriptional regulator
MKEKRLLEPQKITAGLVSQTKRERGPETLVTAKPDERIADVLVKMNEAGVTQLPVVADGRSVGSLREHRILSRVLGNRDLLESSVSEVMEESFPVVDVDASLSDVTRQLQASPAVLVEEYGRITGIITRHDVLDVPTASKHS